jgi:hypothetical protein
LCEDVLRYVNHSTLGSGVNIPVNEAHLVSEVIFTQLKHENKREQADTVHGNYI